MTRLQQCLVAAGMALLLGVVWHYTWMSGDGWWYLAVGRSIVAARGLPPFNDLAFTGHWTHVIHQQWLPYIVFYGLYELGGYATVYFVTAMMMAGGVAATWYAAKARGAQFIPWLVPAIAGAYFLNQDLTVRSEAFSDLLFGALILLVTRARLGLKSPMWVAVILFVVWANSHSSLPLGIIYPAMVFVGWWLESRMAGEVTAIRRPIMWMIVACLFTLANPYGTGIYADIAARLSSGSVNVIEIFKSPDFKDPYNIFQAIWIAFVWIGMFAGRKRPKLDDAAVVSAMTLMFLNGQRYFVFACLAMLPIAAESWSGIVQRILEKKSVVVAATVACMIAAAALFVMPRRNVGVEQPVREAAQALKDSGAGGHVFDYYTWSGFLMWEFPELELFIDSRNNIYEPAKIFDDYILAARGSRHTPEILDMYEIKAVVWPTYERNLFKMLRSGPGWKTIYMNSEAAVFVRAEAPQP